MDTRRAPRRIVGARIRFRPLCGCEAHILGCGGQAIITVKQDSSARRKRFSIAHELGHWRFHRGKTLVCRVDEYRPRDTQSPEKVADVLGTPKVRRPADSQQCPDRVLNIAHSNRSPLPFPDDPFLTLASGEDRGGIALGPSSRLTVSDV
jgi:IrrE N-terminal-like domain